MNTILVK